MKINLLGTNIELTPDIKGYVEEKIGGLERYSDNIIGASVELGKTTEHHNKGNIFRAEVNLQLPGQVIRHVESADNLLPAINAAVKGLKLQINKYKGKKE